MKAELYKRLFKAIYTEDIVSLKKIAITIISVQTGKVKAVEPMADQQE